VKALPSRASAQWFSERGNRGIESAQKEAARMGKGVGREAQLLFDHLAKTYSLQWQGKDIVSELGILIKSPYGAESCSGNDTEALDRFKKLVTTINDKIKSGEIA